MAQLLTLAIVVAGCGSNDRSTSATFARDGSAGPTTISTLADTASTESSVDRGSTTSSASTTAALWIPVMPTLPPPMVMSDVPILLPQPLASGGELYRSGPDEAPAPSPTVLQVYANAAGGWLHVETAPTAEMAGSGETIGPWHVTDRSFSNDSVVELAAATVAVTLWSQSLDVDQLKLIAEQMRQNTDGTWDLGQLPDELELVAVGPAGGWTARRVVQADPARGLVLGLEVITDGVARLSTYGSSEMQVVDVGGKRALYYESSLSIGILGTLVWEYAPRVIVQFGVVDVTVDELIAMARSIRLGTNEEWQSLPDNSGGDGCPAFWC